jgi:hypothetical protein
MASTRNINNSNDYAMRQRLYTGAAQYLAYEPFHVAETPALPALYAPSFLPRDVLCSNSVDVESQLFGINSTNLVSPAAHVTPDNKTLPTVSFCDRQLCFMPNDLVTDQGQRPFFW